MSLHLRVVPLPLLCLDGSPAGPRATPSRARAAAPSRVSRRTWRLAAAGDAGDAAGEERERERDRDRDRESQVLEKERRDVESRKVAVFSPGEIEKLLEERGEWQQRAVHQQEHEHEDAERGQVQEEEKHVEQQPQQQQGSGMVGGTMVGLVLLAGVLGGFGALGFLYKEQINVALLQFSEILDGYGPAGYGLFVVAYTGLEILAVPAIPLTMSAGLLFGSVTGTILVSLAGTMAATASFLIARYLIRDRILEMAKDNKKFLAIDRAIGRDGFKIVTILRLSPLLPFALGNYLYGLTSVQLVPYVLGSWLGMLPGTWAYVSAGAVGKAFIQQESEGLLPEVPENAWILGLGLLATVAAAAYVNQLAKGALKEID